MENQSVERRFKSSIDIKKGLSIEVDSLEDFYYYLPDGAECRDNRNTTEVSEDSTYFIQQSGLFKAITYCYLLDYCTHYGDIYELHTELHGRDINTFEQVRYPLDKGEVLISDIKELLPENISPLVLDELNAYAQYSKHYQIGKFTITPINNVDSLISTCNSWITEIKEIVIDSYCKDIINKHRDYVLANFPQVIAVYELSQVYKKKLYLKVEVSNLEELIFICKHFGTREGSIEKQPFTPKIKDNRLEFLPNGPYYHEDSRLIWESNITSIYSTSLLINDEINLITVIDYEDEEQQYSWFSSMNTLPPLVESNMYLLFKANRTREEILQAYKYPYSNKVEAPLDYPFKYIYPINESAST